VDIASGFFVVANLIKNREPVAITHGPISDEIGYELSLT